MGPDLKGLINENLKIPEGLLVCEVSGESHGVNLESHLAQEYRSEAVVTDIESQVQVLRHHVVLHGHGDHVQPDHRRDGQTDKQSIN